MRPRTIRGEKPEDKKRNPRQVGLTAGGLIQNGYTNERRAGLSYHFPAH
jgi:hypothetical protein